MNKLYVIIFLSFFIFGCQNVENKNSQNQNDSLSDNVGFDGAEKIREVYHRFPTPEEMLSIISVEGINYNPYLLNSTKEIHQYLKSRAQALNLGVFAADLAYLTIYEKHNESIQYFEAIYELSDRLNISSAFSRTLLKRVQENLNNADSLKVLSEQAFISLSDYLESNDNEKIFALISIGGFIEALYLSFNIVGNYQPENPIIQKIADQKFVLENIINYSMPYISDNSVDLTISELSEIRKVYSELSEVESETTVSRNSDGKLLLKGGDKLQITEEQYNKLKELTLSLRRSITQN